MKQKINGIEVGCNIGDHVIGMLIDHGILQEKELLTNIVTDDDPSGFTELGRELFEEVYCEVVSYFD